MGEPRSHDAAFVIRRSGDDTALWAKRAFIGLAILCWLVIASAALWGLAHIARALLLLIIAALLAYALAPVVGRLSRYLPRWLAILLVYVLLIAVLAGFGTIILRTAIEQVTALVVQAKVLLARGPGGTPSDLARTLERFGISQAQIDTWVRAVADQAGVVGREAVPVLTGVANATLDVFLVVVVSIYLLVDGARVSRWLCTCTPRRYRGRITSTLDTFQHVVGGYIRGQVTLAALIGFLVGMGMFIVPATRPFGLLLGLVAFFFEFIPIIGTILSGVICVALALPHGIVWGLVVLGYFVVIHIIEGDVVGPKIVGQAVGLHPVVSIVALIAGAELFGVWGALFASPVAGVIQVIVTDLYVDWQRAHPDELPGEQDDGVAGATKAIVGATAGSLATGGVYRAPDRPPVSREPDAASGHDRPEGENSVAEEKAAT